MTFWESLCSNEVLVSALTGWVVAQVLKTIIDFSINKSFTPERLVGSGGMPSSHSATVCALTTASGMKYGVGSFEFAVSFVLAMIVMYDAMGVRRVSSFEFAISFVLSAVVMYDAIGVRQETGKQAKLLNLIMEQDFFKLDNEHIQKRLKEFVGHTPLQVLAGAVLGILLALWIHSLY